MNSLICYCILYPEENISEHIKFTVKEIREAFDKSSPLEIKWYLFDQQMENQITKILMEFLKEFYNTKTIFSLLYCLKELISNGEKANLKRIVFKENNLDINNENDYDSGIQNFKKNIINKKHYLTKLKEEDKYIKIIFHRTGNYFNISIINNSVISQEEIEKINFRIENASKVVNLLDAYTVFSDNSEGAGLGLITILIALKQMGIGSTGFKIDSFDNYTITRISVPFKPASIDHFNIIYDNLLNEIKEIPPFPENLLQLQNLISSSTSTMKDISDHISKDPILTADLIKTINSPLYMLSNKITNIFAAVKLLGFKRLKIMIYSYGTQKILKKKYNSQKELWDHSYKTAFYAKYLGKSIGLCVDALDKIYLTSILHDIGKAVLNTVNPQLTSKIKLICKQKDISTQELEHIYTGIHHADLGGKILVKWCFPDEIVNCVKKHHNLFDLNEDQKQILYPLFLGNYLANKYILNNSSSNIPPEILIYFKITSLKDFEDKIKVITENFQESQT